MNKILPILIAFVFLVVSSGVARAAELELEKIGGVDVKGRAFTNWTYFGLEPEFAGSTDPLETVVVSIDGVETTVTAGDDGAWIASPEGLDSYGVYEVEISDELSTIIFTLNLAASDTDTLTKGGIDDKDKAVATSLPETGFSDIFVFAGLGALFLAGAVASKYVFSWYE